jgi:A-kinase anchor protein 1
MLATRPLVAASVILPSILLLGYLWQKRRQEDQAASDYQEGTTSSPTNNSTIPVDSREVLLKLESLTRSRLDCIVEERCEVESNLEVKSSEVVDRKDSSDKGKRSERLCVPDLVCIQEKEENTEEFIIDNSFVEAIAVISEAYKNHTVEYSNICKDLTEAKTMTIEENIEVSHQEAIPDVLTALKDPIVSPLSSSPPTAASEEVLANSADDDSLSSPVKSEVSQKSESLSWCDLIEAEEELELEECKQNNALKSAVAATATEEKGRNDSGVASPTEDFSRTETVIAAEEKARISSGEDAGIGGSETDDVSDGNADLATEEAQLFSYHFYIQDYLTGQFIGTKGAAINKLKTSCGCNVIVRDDYTIQNQRRGKLRSNRRYGHGEGHLNLVMLEGTRNNIDKCLDTIRERFQNYPELTLEQMNRPENTSLSLNAGSVALSLVEGIMHDVVISSIVYGDHIFIQQPTNPTFSALERLDACMFNTYSELTCPSLSKPVSPNSICVAPSNGGWYRCQVVSYDESDDTCSIKYVDYGGYDVLPAEQLKQIRTDFLSLPFQAIECRLANIIVPEGDTVSSDILEQLVHGEVIQARMLGVDQDTLPMVHIYRNSNGQTVMVNRELVDRNCAEWIESKLVALQDTPIGQN